MTRLRGILLSTLLAAAPATALAQKPAQEIDTTALSAKLRAQRAVFEWIKPAPASTGLK